jgi:hypothetical protein
MKGARQVGKGVAALGLVEPIQDGHVLDGRSSTIGKAGKCNSAFLYQCCPTSKLEKRA